LHRDRLVPSPKSKVPSRNTKTWDSGLERKEKAKREKILTLGNLSNELNLKELRSFDNFAGFNTASANFLTSVAARGQLNAD
jgi:hypothetical protein